MTTWIWYWKDWLSVRFCLQLAINWWYFFMFSITFWCSVSCWCSTCSRRSSCTWKAVWQRWIGSPTVGWCDGLDCCPACNITRLLVIGKPEPKTQVWKRRLGLQTLLSVCLSVCCMPWPNSRKLKIGRTKADHMGPVNLFRGQRSRSPGWLMLSQTMFALTSHKAKCDGCCI